MFVYFIIILYLTLLLNKFDAIDVCNGGYCPPIPVTWKMDSSYADKEPAPIILQQNDDPSGCECRDHPGDYVVCYGKEENCKFMPLKLKTTSTVLRIKNTQIVQFEKGDFQHLQQLENLLVESNFCLQYIKSGTFNNLTNLINMSISYNTNLKTLENGSFDGLINLKELYLIKNGFTNIYNVTIALSRTNLPNLFEIWLNENFFNEIRENDFHPMLNSSLEVLNLILCRIEFVHSNALIPLKNLQILRIGENNFNTTQVITNVIKNTINNKINLKVVNLCSVGFRKMPPKDLLNVIANSTITHLNLTHNQFEIINNESFPYMPNLFVLDLTNDLILNITNDAFKNLPNLKTLLLNGNKLNGLPDGVLMKNLTYLDLQQNSGNSFSPSSYFSVYKNRFLHMNQLIYLDLSYNRLNIIYNQTFVGLINLQILLLKNASIYRISNNSFIDLQKLVNLSLENNYFIKNEDFTGEVFKGLYSLEELNLSGCSITNFPINIFKYLKKLKYLSLERNKLTSLNAEDFASLIYLKSIDLSYNQLTLWYNRVFVNNQQLKNINLNKNKLAYISLEMFEDFTNLTNLKFDENPFVCDCTSFNYFRKYSTIYPTKNINNLLNENSINCVFPENHNNLTIIQYFEQNNICKTDGAHSLLLILPLVLILVLIISLVVLIYCYRWYIRYWIFLARLYLSRNGKIKITSKTTVKNCYQNYEYDAFVSYSNEDRNFVIRLVTMLENYEPYLKLCVYERDFQIGTIISESVLESVAKSRKTLLIISDNYAKSQWCRWESQIAEHHRLFFGNEHGEYVDDTLVIIKLGPINNNHLTPTLKYLLKTRIYLAWENNEKKQKIFWEKLRNALAPPKQDDILIENTHI